jgi:hypothetical protein
MRSHKTAISLSMRSAVPAKARILIVQVGNSVRPMHFFGRNCDHDYYFKLLRKEEQDTTINYSMFC